MLSTEECLVRGKLSRDHDGSRSIVPLPSSACLESGSGSHLHHQWFAVIGVFDRDRVDPFVIHRGFGPIHAGQPGVDHHAPGEGGLTNEAMARDHHPSDGRPAGRLRRRTGLAANLRRGDRPHAEHHQRENEHQYEGGGGSGLPRHDGRWGLGSPGGEEELSILDSISPVIPCLTTSRPMMPPLSSWFRTAFWACEPSTASAGRRLISGSSMIGPRAIRPSASGRSVSAPAVGGHEPFSVRSFHGHPRFQRRITAMPASIFSCCAGAELRW